MRDWWLRLENSCCLLVDWLSWPIGNRNFPVTVMRRALKSLNVKASFEDNNIWFLLIQLKSDCIHNLHIWENVKSNSVWFHDALNCTPMMPREADSFQYLYWEEFCKRLIRNPSNLSHHNTGILTIHTLVTDFHLFMNQTEVRLFSHDVSTITKINERLCLSA